MATKVNYNDHPYRIVLSLVAAHIMVMYNDPDNFFEALLTPSYRRGMVASYVISYLVFSFIHYLSLQLDKKYEWHEKIFFRVLWQSILGVFVPAIIIFLLVTGYLSLYQINIFQTEYLQQDFPLALLMLLSVNLYYFGLYHFIRYREIIKTGDNTFEQQYVPESHQLMGQLNMAGKTVDLSESKNNNYKALLMVDTLTTTIPVSTIDIAYAYILAGTVFIRLKSMDSINESYQVSYTLKELEVLLDPSQFFRINRQMIVNINNCTGFSPQKKTLVLHLEPQAYKSGENIPQEHTKLHIVSEDRCAKFKVWIDR